MVAPSLDVSSRQVFTKSLGAGTMFVKQEVGQILHQGSVCGGALLLHHLSHLIEPFSPRLVETKDKVVKLKEMILEPPAAVAFEDAGNECVAKAKSNSRKLVDNGCANLVVVHSVGCEKNW